MAKPVAFKVPGPSASDPVETPHQTHGCWVGQGRPGEEPSVPGLPANFSDQRILPVACITTKSVITEMMVIARPVYPFQKNA